MAILVQREVVTFNPFDKVHRKYFMNFMKNGKWDKDAPRFNLDDQFLTVPDMIKYKLTEFYLTEEFQHA